MTRAALTGVLLMGALASAAQAQEPQAQEPNAQASAPRPSTALGDAFGDWVDARLAGDSDAVRAARRGLMDAYRQYRDALGGGDGLSAVDEWEELLETGRRYPAEETAADPYRSFAADGDLGETVLRVPAIYDPTGPARPLLLMLGPADVVPRAAIEQLPQECREQAFVLAPDLLELLPESLSESRRRRVLIALSGTVRRFRVDRNRILVLGSGDGAARAAELAALLPHLFAAAAVAESPGAETHGDANLALLPFRTFPVVDEACRWLLESPDRDPYPAHFSVSFRSPAAGRVFWVQAMKFDPAGVAAELARLDVTVDRSSNTIRLDGTRVYRVTLFLNDRIVDLDRPIRIVRNGVPYEFQAVRSFRTLLENFAINLDPRAVYPAMVRDLDLPAHR